MDVVTCVVVLYPVQSPHVRVRASAPTQAAGGPSSCQHKGTLNVGRVGDRQCESGVGATACKWDSINGGRYD